MDKEKALEFYARGVSLYEKGLDDLPDIMDAYWDELSDFIASDISGAIQFLCEDSACTDEIFLDWSSVFEDVVRKTQSREFINGIKRAAKRFPKASAQGNIPTCIAFAEAELND